MNKFKGTSRFDNQVNSLMFFYIINKSKFHEIYRSNLKRRNIKISG